uniref:Uncharacterized protein n=1 Tax=Anguilla anguilla TaxID=7936 RepID=A0A0E9XB22_ANGAN
MLVHLQSGVLKENGRSHKNTWLQTQFVRMSERGSNAFRIIILKTTPTADKIFQ